MTFSALLLKELRLSMRRERTIWVMVIYVLITGLLGWVTINGLSSSEAYNANSLGYAGTLLYYMLSFLQLIVVLFITPAFTATSVNGEKERQTFDLLLCSRLSGFSLILGKLLAGVMNTLLLIAASAPLFSLVLFFGGVAPSQIFKGLLVYICTTLVVGTFGLFCSTLVQRPAVTTAISYMACLIWMVFPLVITIITLMSPHTRVFIPNGNPAGTHQSNPLWLAINPVVALVSTYPNAGSGYIPASLGILILFYPPAIYSPGTGVGTYSFLGFHLEAWQVYIALSLLLSTLFVLLSVWTVKPNPVGRLRVRTDQLRTLIRRGKSHTLRKNTVDMQSDSLS